MNFPKTIILFINFNDTENKNVLHSQKLFKVYFELEAENEEQQNGLPMFLLFTEQNGASTLVTQYVPIAL